MRKHRLCLVLAALVPILFVVWSAPPSVTTSRQLSLAGTVINMSTLGALSGMESITDYLSGPSDLAVSTPQPEVTWSTSLALAREARMNGKLSNAERYISQAIGTLLFEEYNEKKSCSLESTYHVSWPYNSSLVACLDEATEIYREMANYSSATNYTRVALNQVEYSLRKQHSSDLQLKKAQLLNTLASIRLQQARYGSKTIVLLKKVEETLNNCSGPMHSERGALYHNLAMVEHYKENYKEAVRLYLLAMSIRQQSLGDNSETVAETYGDLGLLYIEQNNFTKGIPLVEKAISVFSSVRGESHPWTNWYCDQLGYLLLRAGKFEEGSKFLKRAYEGRKASLGKKHPLTRRTRKMYKAALRISKSLQSKQATLTKIGK